MDDHRQQGLKKVEERIKSGVSLVGFESPSCDPCRVQEPIMKALADRFQGVARVIDLNIDDNRQFAMRLGVTSIPTLIIFKNGMEMRRFVGLQRTDVLSRALEAALG